ncbi:uncharacterized protein LOC144062691 [Vanacampus margaritifer]
MSHDQAQKTGGCHFVLSTESDVTASTSSSCGCHVTKPRKQGNVQNLFGSEQVVWKQTAARLRHPVPLVIMSCSEEIMHSQVKTLRHAKVALFMQGVHDIKAVRRRRPRDASSLLLITSHCE